MIKITEVTWKAEFKWRKTQRGEMDRDIIIVRDLTTDEEAKKKVEMPTENRRNIVKNVWDQYAR